MIVLVFAYLTIAHLASHPTIALSRKFLPPEVKAESSDHNMLKHLKSCLSTLTLICRNPFCALRLGLTILVPAGHPGPGFCFEKPVSHSPAQPSLKKPGSVRPYPKPDGLAGNTGPNCSSSGITVRHDLLSEWGCQVLELHLVGFGVLRYSGSSIGGP